ncbi:MAG: hypothetical protein HYY62_02420 [Deltaproteobacteria bacterium]|nr:hypothetical protein [Deltaproteobacteria bacterium]
MKEGYRLSLKPITGAPLFYIQGPFHPLKTITSQGPFTLVTSVLFSGLPKEVQDRYIEERALNREAMTPQDEVAISIPLSYKGLDIAPSAKEYDCYECTPVQKAVLAGLLIQGNLPAPPPLFSGYDLWHDDESSELPPTALYRPGSLSRLILNPAYAQIGEPQDLGFRGENGKMRVYNNQAFPFGPNPFGGHNPSGEEFMAASLMMFNRTMYIMTEDRNSWSPLYQEFQDTILEDVSDDDIQTYTLSPEDQKIISDILFGEAPQSEEELRFLKKVGFYLDGIDQGWKAMRDVHLVLFEEVVPSEEVPAAFQALGVQSAPSAPRFQPQNVHREILIKTYVAFLKYAQLNPKESNAVQKLFKDIVLSLKTYGDPAFHSINNNIIIKTSLGPGADASQMIYHTLLSAFKTAAFVSGPRTLLDQMAKEEDPRLRYRDPEQAAQIAEQNAQDIFDIVMFLYGGAQVGKAGLSSARSQLLKGEVTITGEKVMVTKPTGIPVGSPKILKLEPGSPTASSKPPLNSYRGASEPLQLRKKCGAVAVPQGRFHQVAGALYRRKRVRVGDFDEQKAIDIMRGDKVDPRLQLSHRAQTHVARGAEPIKAMEKVHQTNVVRPDDKFYKALVRHTDAPWGRPLDPKNISPGGQRYDIGGSPFVSSTTRREFVENIVDVDEAGYVIIKINPSKVKGVDLLKAPPKYRCVFEETAEEAEFSISGGIPGSAIDEIIFYQRRTIHNVPNVTMPIWKIVREGDGSLQIIDLTSAKVRMVPPK